MGFLLDRRRVCRSLPAGARATVVEDWLDDMIDITDRDDLDPLDKRVRIDARRWIMSKLAPGRYGDKVILGGDGTLGGLGGAAVSLSDLSDEQLAALEAGDGRKAQHSQRFEMISMGCSTAFPHLAASTALGPRPRWPSRRPSPRPHRPAKVVEPGAPLPDPPCECAAGAVYLKCPSSPQPTIACAPRGLG
jgi:hypothetical protein